MRFSHSLLSPQAWVFLRCGLGGGCIRAELAEGEVCLAWEEEEGGLLRHHAPPPRSGQGHFQRKCPKEKGPAWSGDWPWHSMEESASRQSPGGLSRECPARMRPRPPPVRHRLWVEIPAVLLRIVMMYPVVIIRQAH